MSFRKMGLFLWLMTLMVGLVLSLIPPPLSALRVYVVFSKCYIFSLSSPEQGSLFLKQLYYGADFADQTFSSCGHLSFILSSHDQLATNWDVDKS